MRIKVFHVTYVYFDRQTGKWRVSDNTHRPQAGDLWIRRYSSEDPDGDIYVATQLVKMINTDAQLRWACALQAKTFNTEARWLEQSA
jgi:hypothetical protein